MAEPSLRPVVAPNRLTGTQALDVRDVQAQTELSQGEWIVCLSFVHLFSLPIFPPIFASSAGLFLLWLAS